MRRVTHAVPLLALVVALAGNGCGSSSTGGDGGGSGSGGSAAGGTGGGGTGGSGGGSSGAVTFSCYETGELCTQILVQPSGVAAEQQTCAGPLEDGVSGTGCPTAGLLGCCQSPATDPSHEEQCTYDASSLTIAMQLCANMTGHIWSSTI